MSKTQSTFKTIAEAQFETTDDTPETPDVRRSEVVQVIPLPDVDRFSEWAEWQQVAATVETSVVAAISEDA